MTNASTLTEKQLRQIWNANIKLRKRIKAEYIKIESMWVNSFIELIKNGLESYDIGFYKTNKIFVGNKEQFLEDLKLLNHITYFLDDEDKELFDEVYEVLQVTYRLKPDSVVYSDLWKLLDSYIIVFQEKVSERFKELTKINDEILFNYFLTNRSTHQRNNILYKCK